MIENAAESISWQFRLCNTQRLDGFGRVQYDFSRIPDDGSELPALVKEFYLAKAKVSNHFTSQNLPSIPDMPNLYKRVINEFGHIEAKCNKPNMIENMNIIVGLGNSSLVLSEPSIVAVFKTWLARHRNYSIVKRGEFQKDIDALDEVKKKLTAILPEGTKTLPQEYRTGAFVNGKPSGVQHR